MQNFLEKWTQGLDHAEYVHVLLNHLPVTGMLVSLIVLLAGALMGNRGTMLLALLLTALFAVLVYPVVEAGEQAANVVSPTLDETGRAWLEHHKHAANAWYGKWVFYATGAFALVAFILGAIGKKTLWLTVPLTVILILGSLASGLYISEFGGRIQHDEFRYTEPPAHEHNGEEHQEAEAHEHDKGEHHAPDPDGVDDGEPEPDQADELNANEQPPATQPGTTPADQESTTQENGHDHEHEHEGGT